MSLGGLFFYVMKLIHRFANGEVEVECDEVLESLFDVDDYIEFEGRDWRILQKDGKRYILR